jgi:hypothetical protein
LIAEFAHPAQHIATELLRSVQVAAQPCQKTQIVELDCGIMIIADFFGELQRLTMQLR